LEAADIQGLKKAQSFLHTKQAALRQPTSAFTRKSEFILNGKLTSELLLFVLSYSRPTRQGLKEA